jgi:hypothetical protein
MVSMELFNIVEDIKKVSKPFVVYPRNVNAENATSMWFLLQLLQLLLNICLLPVIQTDPAF